MKIAVVTTRLFERPGNGGEVCTARLLGEIVRAGHSVVLIGRGPVPGAGMPGVCYASVGPLVEPFERIPRVRQMLMLGAAWLRGRASTVHRLAQGGVTRQVARWLEQTAPDLDVLIVDHLQVLPWLDGHRGKLPTLLMLMHNLESQHYADWAQRAATGGQWWRQGVLRLEARRLHALECAALRRASVVACLTAGDAWQLGQASRACGGRARLAVLPAFPLPAGPAAGPAPAAAAAAAGPPRRRIGMIGTWTWEPNRLALRWMLECVLPHLPGDCVLVVAGTGLEGLTLPDRVVSQGRLDQTEAFYASVDVVALSAHVGSGVQEKAVEAIARARLVVATPHSLRGLKRDLPGHVQVTADARQFADLCAHAPLAPAAIWATAVQAWGIRRQRHYADVLGRCLASVH